MPNQRHLLIFNVTQTGVTDPRKWAGQSATFYFAGNFGGGTITVEISPDREEWYDPDYNAFTEKSVRTLWLGTGEWIRLNAIGGAPDVVCKISGETNMGRG